MLIYRSLYEIAFMFLNMSRIVLKNNLIAINRKEEYYKIRNKSKILYAIITMITAFIMSSGFFLILATRDSFQVYIEDVALHITNINEQQKIMIDIEVYRKIGTLILSAIFTLVLMKYELIMIEFILLSLSIIEIFINKKLCKKLEQVEWE